ALPCPVFAMLSSTWTKRVSCSKDSPGSSNVTFDTPKIAFSFSCISFLNIAPPCRPSNDRPEQLAGVDHKPVETLRLGRRGAVVPVIAANDWVSDDSLKGILNALHVGCAARAK